MVPSTSARARPGAYEGGCERMGRCANERARASEREWGDRERVRKRGRKLANDAALGDVHPLGQGGQAVGADVLWRARASMAGERGERASTRGRTGGRASGRARARGRPSGTCGERRRTNEEGRRECQPPERSQAPLLEPDEQSEKRHAQSRACRPSPPSAGSPSPASCPSTLESPL